MRSTEALLARMDEEENYPAHPIAASTTARYHTLKRRYRSTRAIRKPYGRPPSI